nr:capsular polysaccharide biosynthesis protein [uncultured Cohaesibacter sp.]
MWKFLFNTLVSRLYMSLKEELGCEDSNEDVAIFGGWRNMELVGVSGKKVFIFGFSHWKLFIKYWIENGDVCRGPFRLSKSDFWFKWRWRLSFTKNSEVYVWSYKSPIFLERFCEAKKIPLIRVEDGFLRSVDLGARHTVPLSLCFDRSGYLYFDSTGQSDLERMLQTYNFESDSVLLDRAERGIEALIESRLSKYNISIDVDIEKIYGPKIKKRILVIGQVEGDMSIVNGCDRPIDNNAFVRFVAEQNPDAQVIYKPHPEVLSGIRKKPPQSNPDDVNDVALVLKEDIALSDSFNTVDLVCTISSLAGFEALIRGIPVYCYGMPFYAGWGATLDRQICSRRTKKRSVVEIFAAAYILYPTYRNPITNQKMEFEEALKLLGELKRNSFVESEPG